MSTTSALLEPATAGFSSGASCAKVGVHEGVCRCGHGLCLHQAGRVPNPRACRVCPLTLDQGSDTPGSRPCYDLCE